MQLLQSTLVHPSMNVEIFDMIDISIDLDAMYSEM